MKQVCFIFVTCLFTCLAGCDSSPKDDSNTRVEEKNEKNFEGKAEVKEANFVADVIEEQYAEIKLAELASIKSSNKEIQDFAQQLVHDHTKALQMFQALADRKGITVPAEEGEKAKEKVNDLSKQEDPDFDKKWRGELIARHQKTIREFEAMYDKSEDAELREIINNTLMDLRAQLEKINALENKIK